MEKPQPLSDHELEAALKELPDWRVEEGKLAADYQFTDFKTAFSFMSEIASEADKQDHHPEWSNVYNRVNIALRTHEADDSITARDTELAKHISRIATRHH